MGFCNNMVDINFPVYTKLASTLSNDFAKKHCFKHAHSFNFYPVIMVPVDWANDAAIA